MISLRNFRKFTRLHHRLTNTLQETENWNLHSFHERETLTELVQIFISEKCKKSLITLWLESMPRPDLSDPLGASQSGSPSFLHKSYPGDFPCLFYPIHPLTQQEANCCNLWTTLASVASSLPTYNRANDSCMITPFSRLLLYVSTWNAMHRTKFSSKT